MKPEFWSDERLGRCSHAARLLFIATWTFADDYGNLGRSSPELRALAFPYEDGMDVEPLLRELLVEALLVEYSVGGRTYLHIVNFGKHQYLRRRLRPNCPAYEGQSATVLTLVRPDGHLPS